MTVCSKPECDYKTKRYGVCGVHKKWAFTDQSPNFQIELNKLGDLIQKYKTQAANLEQQGYNILQIQTYWNNNLTKTPIDKLPPHFYSFGLLINQIRDYITEMQGRFDPYLVYNAQVRLHHSDIPNCHCQYCRLRCKTGELKNRRKQRLNRRRTEK